MGIGKLQKGGQSFRMSYGAGNFTKQFNKETKHGELQNLRDNKKTILKVVDKYKNYIRRNILGRKLQKKAYLEITKEEGNKLTIGDKRDIKKVLKHFSEKDSIENKPEPVPVSNRAKAEDPSNSVPDSLVKKVGSRFVINSDPLSVEKADNPIEYHALGLIKKEKIVSKRINIQRAETPVIPEPANKVEDFERKESILAASPLKNVAKPVDVKKAETSIVHQPINIERAENPIPSQEDNQIDYHALGLIKRKTTPLKPRLVNIEKAENPIVPEPANKVEDFERKESVLAASPLKNIAKPVDVKKAETPIVHRPINIERAEVPIPSQKENPIDYHALGLIKRKTTPLKPRLVNIEKAETPVVPKPVDAKKIETVKKVETPIVHQPTNIERKETPVVPPPIEVKKKIIIQRAENPAENPIAPGTVKAKKKESPAPPQFVNPVKVEKKINIQKAEAQPDKDIPNIADLEKPTPDNIPSPDNNISPSKEEVRTNRGDAVRAKINYEHALNLGGSEAAQDIQKKAFEKMNNINNSLDN